MDRTAYKVTWPESLSPPYLCPNTGSSVQIDYTMERLLVKMDEGSYSVPIPFGLLVRVLDNELRLLRHVIAELGVDHALLLELLETAGQETQRLQRKLSESRRAKESQTCGP